MSDPEAQSTEKYPGLHKLVMRALVAGSENGTVTDAYEKAEAFIEAHDASRQADLLAAVGEDEPLRPWLSKADPAGIRNIHRSNLREAINEVYGDKSWTPETFEEQLEKRKREAVTLFHNDHADGDAAIYRLCAAILAAHTTALEAAKREARIDELDRKMTLHVELLSSPDFKAGFSAALDQIDAANIIRKAELSHPNQPKQVGGEE